MSGIVKDFNDLCWFFVFVLSSQRQFTNHVLTSSYSFPALLSYKIKFLTAYMKCFAEVAHSLCVIDVVLITYFCFFYS